MHRGRGRSDIEDPWVVLGLTPGAPEVEIHAARRRLAKAVHPDVGGSVDAMQRVNDAALRALGVASGGSRSDRVSRQPPAPPSSPPAERPYGGMRHDHPSFTVEALPAETYEGLSIVATWLGEVLVDEPPYELEVVLHEPLRGWCRLDIVPDAGAATVSLAVGALPGGRTPDLDAVRDAWIDGLNRLDWSDPDGNGPASQGV